MAARVIPSPVPHADFVTSTTYKTLLGPHGGVILCRKAFASKIDRAIFPGTQGTSTPPLIAAKAVCFKLAAEPGFARVQARTLRNARAVAEALAERGYRPVSGGTDNHMALIDLRTKGLTGNIAERALEEVGLLVNRNLIPFDPESPQITSGLRVGASGLARRGMGEPETGQVAAWMDRVLQAPADATVKEEVGRRVLALCTRFPIPETLAREETGP